MYVAARSYLATGVAVVGASALAISPLSPVSTPLPDIAVPAISSAAVELTSLANPLELWIQVLSGAVDNAGALGQDWLSDPVPVLRQIAANQIGNIEALVGAGQDVVNGVVQYFSPDYPYGFHADIRRAAADFSAGDIAAGVSTLASAFILGPIIQALGAPLLFSGVLDIPVQILQNVTDAVAALLNPATALPLLTGALGPIMAPINALGGTGQEISDSLAAGDLGAALTAIVNLPAELTGAFLNGYTDVSGNAWAGLLTHSTDGFSGGLLQALLVTIPRAIAEALGAPSFARTAATDEVSALATEPAATVTVDVPGAAPAVVSTPAQESTVPADKAGAPEPSGAAPAVPAADEEPAEEPVTDEVPAGEVPAEEAPAEEAPADQTEGDVSEEDSTTEDEDGSEDSPAEDSSADDDAAADDSSDNDPSSDDSSDDDSSGDAGSSGASEKTAAA